MKSVTSYLRKKRSPENTQESKFDKKTLRCPLEKVESLARNILGLNVFLDLDISHG